MYSKFLNQIILVRTTILWQYKAFDVELISELLKSALLIMTEIKNYA